FWRPHALRHASQRRARSEATTRIPMPRCIQNLTPLPPPLLFTLHSSLFTLHFSLIEKNHFPTGILQIPLHALPNDRGDLFWVERFIPSELYLGHQMTEHRRFHRTGGDRVDADSIHRPFASQRPPQQIHPRLGR